MVNATGLGDSSGRVAYCGAIRQQDTDTTMGRVTSAQQPRRRAGGAGLAVAITLVGAVSLAALGYVGFLLWPRWPAAETAAVSAPSLPITVGGVIFNVPPAAIQNPSQRSAGAQPRLDLAFQWPELTPPTHSRPMLSEDLKPNYLFLTIMRPQGTLPLMERIRTIYPRYTGSDAFAGPAGLTGVPFRDNTPYQGEDLFVDVGHPDSFTVRCTRPAGPVPGMCLLERPSGQADVMVRFPREWLENWRAISTGTDTLLSRLTSANSGT